MRAEKRRSQGGLCQGKQRQTEGGERMTFPSEILWWKTTENSSAHVWSWDTAGEVWVVPRGGRKKRGWLGLSPGWRRTRAASGWCLQRSGEGPAGCQGYVSISFITHKVLCTWEESQARGSQWRPATGLAFPPFLSLSSSLKSRQPAKAPQQSVKRALGGRGEEVRPLETALCQARRGGSVSGP